MVDLAKTYTPIFNILGKPLNKNGGWKTTLFLERPSFRGELSNFRGVYLLDGRYLDFYLDVPGKDQWLVSS